MPVKVDIELPENQETTQRYRITSIPAILFLSPGGGVVAQTSYALPNQFIPVMKEALETEKDFQQKLAKLKKKPENVELNGEVALTYFKRQQAEKALPISEKVFKLDPKNRTDLLPELHTQLGLHYGHQIEGKTEEVAAENFQKAVKHFRTVIDTYPKSDFYESAQFYLGTTYAIKGKYVEAIDVLEKLTHHAKDPAVKQQAELTLTQVKNLANADD